jgi:hypothetical protein
MAEAHRTPARYNFRFRDFFSADDVVAEWVATLALAYNDLVLLRERLIDDQVTEHRWFYWLRLMIGHFAEAATYLRDSSQISEIADFIDSLPDDVKEHRRVCLEIYERLEEPIERIRNQAGFHYPEMRAGRRRRSPVQRALDELAQEVASVEVGPTHTVRGSRMLFADDVAGQLVLQASGGLEALGEVHRDVEAAIGSFVRFAHLVIDEFLARRAREGGEWTQEVDEGNVS